VVRVNNLQPKKNYANLSMQNKQKFALYKSQQVIANVCPQSKKKTGHKIDPKRERTQTRGLDIDLNH